MGGKRNRITSNFYQRNMVKNLKKYLISAFLLLSVLPAFAADYSIDSFPVTDSSTDQLCGWDDSAGDSICFTPTEVKTLLAYTTSDISEGSNLYFTNERAEDAIGAILTDSATIDFTYTDNG